MEERRKSRVRGVMVGAGKGVLRRKNRKRKYQRADGLFPFVRLRDANGRSYPAAEQFLADVEERMHKAALEREATRKSLSAGRTSSPLRDIENFRQNPIYAADGTRIDLAYAIYALSFTAPLQGGSKEPSKVAG